MEFIAMTDARRGGLRHSHLPNLTPKRPRWDKPMIAKLREQAERHGYTMIGCKLFQGIQPANTYPIGILHYQDTKIFLDGLELAKLDDQELQQKATIAKSSIM